MIGIMEQSTIRKFDDCEDAYDFCKFHVELILADVDKQADVLKRQVKDGKLNDGMRTLDQIILFMDRIYKLMDFIPNEHEERAPAPIYG